jgi:hypothetical protein
MRRSLVIYDFAPDPSELPNTRGKFIFFLSVHLDKKTKRQSNRTFCVAQQIFLDFISVFDERHKVFRLIISAISCTLL